VKGNGGKTRKHRTRNKTPPSLSHDILNQLNQSRTGWGMLGGNFIARVFKAKQLKQEQKVAWGMGHIDKEWKPSHH
jgi:hypothetical protein